MKINHEIKDKEIESFKKYYEKYKEAVDKFDEIFNLNKNLDREELEKIIVSELRKADPDGCAIKYYGNQICICDGLLSIKKMIDFEESLEDVKEIYRKYRKIPIFFFPSEYNGINTSRARKINDRVDHTLYDLKKYFESKENCILIDAYNLPETKKWLESVKTFENLIDWLDIKGIFTDDNYNIFDIETGILMDEEKYLQHKYTKKYYENLKKKIDEYMDKVIIKIKEYNDVEKLGNLLKEKDIIVDLSECNNNLRVRILDFINGLVFYNGKIIKLDRDNFKVTLRCN